MKTCTSFLILILTIMVFHKLTIAGLVKDDIEFQVKVNVILLHKDLLLNLTNVQQILDKSLKVRYPFNIDERGNGTPLKTRFNIQYDVRSHSVEGYEQLLEEMISKQILKEERSDNFAHFNLPVTNQLSDYFDFLLSQYLSVQGIQNTIGEYTIFLAAPDKQRMLLNIQKRLQSTTNNNGRASAPTTYHYALSYLIDSQGRYLEDSSACFGQNWVSKGRYVVADLTAGPSVVGMGYTTEGIVNSQFSSFVSQTQREVQLASLVISAVQQLFVPDVHLQSAHHAEKVLVPLIVLRNHNLHEPFAGIDVEAIRKELNSILSTAKEVNVVSGVHSLHEHQHLSVSFAKAMRADSSYSATPEGKFGAVLRPYLDSKVLLHHLKSTEDLLASGLIGASIDSLQRIFFNPKLPAASTLQQQSSTAHQSSSATPNSNSNSPLSGGSSSSGTRSQGLRILPVYVFSILGQDKELLLDNHQLESSTSETVIVLQTHGDAVKVPHVCRTSGVLQNMVLYPLNVTRSIVAGIAKAVGGLVDPTQRYSKHHNKIIVDYSWALGHHPFSHFSGNNSALSQIFLDTIVRNIILSRITYASELIDAAVNEIDLFAREYLVNPFTDETSHNTFNSSSYEWVNWVDKLSRNKENLDDKSLSSVSLVTVYQLWQELLRMDHQLETIHPQLAKYNLFEALQLTSSLHQTSQAFHDFVFHKIEETRNALLCCSPKTVVVGSAQVMDYLTPVLLGLVLFAVVVAFVKGFKMRGKMTK